VVKRGRFLSHTLHVGARGLQMNAKHNLHLFDGYTEVSQMNAKSDTVKELAERVLAELEVNLRFHTDIFPPSLCVLRQAGPMVQVSRQG